MMNGMSLSLQNCNQVDANTKFLVSNLQQVISSKICEKGVISATGTISLESSVLGGGAPLF